MSGNVFARSFFGGCQFKEHNHKKAEMVEVPNMDYNEDDKVLSKLPKMKLKLKTPGVKGCNICSV
jgi:hypothetical protein